MPDVMQTIEAQYQGFSPSQKKIARYLSQHIAEAILLSSAQIANKAGVSEATVTRFITRLGFAGHADFKRRVGQQLLGQHYTPKRLAESADAFDKTDSALNEILKADMANIQALAAGVSADRFDSAVRRLSSARAIYVLGLRSSHSLAVYMTFNLRFFFTSVHIIAPGIEDVPEQLIDVGKGDVLVAFSFKRYTRRVVDIAERIKHKGAHVIAITGHRLTHLGRMAHTTLVVNTEIPSYIQSFTAAMSLINALVTAVAVNQRDRALPALERLEKEFAAYDLFLE